MFSIFLALQISTTLEVELRLSSSLRMICFIATGSAQKKLYFTVIASPSAPISIARPAFSLDEEGWGLWEQEDKAHNGEGGVTGERTVSL